mgnify:CR=1 FL=1
MQPGRVMTSEELAEALAERERVEAKIEKFRLAALDDVIDAGRDMVAIGAAAEEKGHIAGNRVARGKRFQLAFDRLLVRC